MTAIHSSQTSKAQELSLNEDYLNENLMKRKQQKKKKRRSNMFARRKNYMECGDESVDEEYHI